MANKQKIQEGFYEHTKSGMVTYVERQDSKIVSYYFGQDEPLEILNAETFLENFQPVNPRKTISELEAKVDWIKEMIKKQPIRIPKDFPAL